MMIEEIAVSEVLGQVAFAARREGEAHHLGLRKQVESSEADVVALSLAGVEFFLVVPRCPLAVLGYRRPELAGHGQRRRANA